MPSREMTKYNKAGVWGIITHDDAPRPDLKLVSGEEIASQDRGKRVCLFQSHLPCLFELLLRSCLDQQVKRIHMIQDGNIPEYLSRDPISHYRSPLCSYCGQAPGRVAAPRS